MNNIFRWIILVTCLGFYPAFGQKAEKGFRQLEKGELSKAKEQFDKVLRDDSTNCAAHFGLSIVISSENYPEVDYFKAWDHFLLANKYFNNLTDDDNIFLKEFFTLRDSERRNKPTRFNFDVEEKIIEGKLIKYVREENKLEIAEKFIKVYPNSRYYENVIHIRNHIEFRKAEKLNTLEAYTGFLKRFPDAAQVDEAKKARNELAFQWAKKTNTVPALEQFIHDYPEAYHLYDAIKLRDQLAFDMAKKENTMEAFDLFISKYPNSLHIPSAKIIQRKLLYEKAKQVNTLEAYNEFVSRYPEGDYFVDIFNLKSNVLGQNLLKSAQGNLEMVKWIKGFDFEQKNDSAGGIVLTPDKNIVIAGTRSKKSGYGTEAWLVAINSEGKTLWDKSFGSKDQNVVKGALLSPKNEILVGGWNANSTDTAQRESWLFSLSTSGSGQWERNLEGKEIQAIRIMPTGEIYTSGYQSGDSVPAHLHLVKYNENYQKLWSRNYLKNGTLYSFIVTPAQSQIMGEGRWLWKSDGQGYIVWEKQIPPTDSLIAINSLPGGLFFITGWRNNAPYIAKMNDQGIISWEKNLTDRNGFQFDYATLLADKSILARFQGNGYFGLLQMTDKGEIKKEIRFPQASAPITHSIVQNDSGEFYLIFTQNNNTNSEMAVIKIVTN